MTYQYIEGACETTCTRWRHKPDRAEPDLGYCSFCYAAVGTLIKNAACTITTSDPQFPQPDPAIPHWRDTIRDGTSEVAA